MSRQFGAPTGEVAGIGKWQDLLQRPVLWSEAGILKQFLGEDDGEDMTGTMGVS